MRVLQSSRILRWTIVLLVLAIQSTGIKADSAEGLSLQYSRILDLHNQHRKDHGADPLTWDPNLQKSAQAYAIQCTWEHSVSKVRNGAGENMYYSTGYPVVTVGDRAVRNWYQEAADYDWASPGQPIQGKESAILGHFTQVVWRTTQRIGCAMIKCVRLVGTPYHNTNFVVCHYYPPGNMVVTNVGGPSRYSFYSINVAPFGSEPLRPPPPPPSPPPPCPPPPSPPPPTSTPPPPSPSTEPSLPAVAGRAVAGANRTSPHSAAANQKTAARAGVKRSPTPGQGRLQPAPPPPPLPSTKAGPAPKAWSPPPARPTSPPPPTKKEAQRQQGLVTPGRGRFQPAPPPPPLRRTKAGPAPKAWSPPPARPRSPPPPTKKAAQRQQPSNLGAHSNRGR